MRAKQGILCFFALCGCAQEPLRQPTGARSEVGHVGPSAQPARREDTLAQRGHIGVLLAKESVNVSSQTSGVIKEILVDIGDSMVAGQPIAQIDPRALQSELDIALANARAAGAKSRRLQVEMEAAVLLAKRQVEMGSEVIAKQEIESAKTTAASSAASYAESGAANSAARSRVAQLRQLLDQATIRAPFAGKIAQRLVSTGESVTIGTPIALLITAESLQVDFVVPLEDRDRYNVGDSIRVELESSESEISGVVRRISPSLDSVTQMTVMQADLVVDDGNHGALQSGVGVWVKPQPRE
ncbi:MAG: efflux RND transporter periplasmic adaptor subunit [Myxococcales bacterium]|nr:efflux RND transporter periplasmic adaptor subunit [Myxococcales bacterium]